MSERMITDTHLHAYIDGQLDAAQRAVVDAWLRAHPAHAQRLARYQEISQQLRTRFAAEPAAALPDSVLRLLQATAPEPEPEPEPRLELELEPSHHVDNIFTPPTQFALPAWWRRVAAMAAFLFLGTVAGWLLHSGARSIAPLSMMVERAMEAHRLYARESRHAVEVGAADRNHLMTWLSSRLGQRIGPADLSAAGYVFLGGRLLPLGDQAAGLYFYEDAQHLRLTELITAAPDSTAPPAPDCHAQGDLGVCVWRENTLTFVVVGAQARESLQKLATQIRAQTLSTTP